jgi:hypothetical protein
MTNPTLFTPFNSIYGQHKLLVLFWLASGEFYQIALTYFKKIDFSLHPLALQSALINYCSALW